jgi:integrase
MGEGPKLVWHRGILAVSFMHDGKRFRRSLGTDDIATARQRMADYLNAKDRKTDTGPITVSEIYQAYVNDRQAEGKAVIRINDAWRRLKPTFASLTPALIDRKVCKDYTEHRRSEGISDGTIHLELGYLRSAMKFASREKMIDKPPYIPLPQKPPPRSGHLTREQAIKLIDAAVMPHVKLFITIALATAGRAEAILDLTWDRVDFNRRRIDLRDPDRAATPKGRALVPMNDMAFGALQEAYKGALTKFVVEWSGERVKSIKKGVGAAGKRVGIKVSPHVLRHTAAVWMAERGRPMSEIAQYLGHTNSATTERVYARYSPDYLKQSADALEL